MKYILSEAHGIGDCILILPVAKAIKKADPNAHIVVFTKSDRKKIQINKAIMSLQHYVDGIEYYSVSEKHHSIMFLLKNMFKRFDYGVAIQDYDTPKTSMIPSIILRLCVKKTCGTRITQRSNIKYDLFVNREKGVRRDELFYRAFDKLGISYEKDVMNLLDESLIKKHLPNVILNKVNKTVAVVMGTAPVSLKTEEGVLKNDAKSWPFENWHALAEKLSDNGINVLLLGGNKELEELNSLGFDFSKENIHNFVGRLKIEQSIALLSLADLVVGADTGLMHCAGALGKPSLTLFGCTDPIEYLPFGERSEYIFANVECSPCFGTLNSVKCEHKKCMQLITIKEVFERINKQLLK